MEARETIYTLESEDSGRSALKALRSGFACREETSLPARRTYLDTFDGRLFKREAALSAAPAGDGVHLLLEPGPDLVPLRLEAAAAPDFSWDLPEGAFRDALEPLIEMRRLLPIAGFERRGPWLALLDGREKTVARVCLERRHVVDGDKARPRREPVLRVRPVRGYDRAFAGVVRFLDAQLGAGAPRRAHTDELARLSGRAGYSSKLRIPLDPALRTDAAMQRVLRALLKTMRANEPGLRENLDSEFLHDFRVAVRRTRSALGRVKGVFPARGVARFRREFAWLGGVTGPTRDLDVYLLKMPDYRAHLPPEVGAALEPLRAFLERRQRRAHRALVRRLDSARYARLLRAWDAFLHRPLPRRPRLANAARPILDVARERTWKAYRRVRDDGRAIAPESGAEALHRLRIDAKKLRYLMEFFRALHEPEAIARQIKCLKQLQDLLGDFNDLQIQQESLRAFAAELAEGGRVGPDTLTAMGRLIENLALRQQAERLAFGQHFAFFDSAANRREARRLFRPARGQERQT